MKTIHVALLLILPLTIVAGEVKRGDTVEDVHAALGAPRGQSQLGARELLYFDRGEVELSAGVVTRVALRSEEVQTALEAKRATEADQFRQKQGNLMTEGTALKTRMLADPTFQATPLSYQVSFWQNFARKYPMVSCVENLGIAQARLNEQVEATQKAEEAQRIADLEAETRAKAREDRDRIFYPIVQPAGYNRYHYTSERRQQRLDREYFERVCDSSNEQPDSVGQNSAGHHDQEYRPVRPVRSAPATTRLFDLSQPSSHTAEAFAGKNWLAWPTPAKPSRIGQF